MPGGLGRYGRGQILFRQACQLLWPRRCPLCGQVLGSLPGLVCPDCEAQKLYYTRFQPTGRLTPPSGLKDSPLAWAAVPFWYKDGIRQGVVRAKYGGQPWTAVQLGCLLAHKLFGAEVRVRAGVEVPTPLAERVVDCDLIVPMPSSGRGRYYNVPALMGLPLARALDIRMEERALLRTRQGTAQAGLSKEERLINAAGLFRADARYTAGWRILLLDDVITTGATAGAAARALMQAGAASVALVGFAASEWDQGLPALPGCRLEGSCDDEFFDDPNAIYI